MIRKPLLALALAALVVPAATAAPALSVDEIVAKHFAAQGGVEKLKKVQTWRMTGKMTMGPGMEAVVTMSRKRPARSRLEFSANGMTGIRVIDGQNSWQFMPFMGQAAPERLRGEELADAVEQADFDGPLMDWKEKGHALELVGTEPVEGADAHKLKLTRKGGKVEYFYLDAETYLTVKREAKRNVRGTEIEGDAWLSDYKEVAGMMVPFTTSQGMKGSERRQAMSFDKIEADVAIDGARFAIPGASTAAPVDSAKAAPAKAGAAKKGK
jgi:outer membrane lipoprotein-sorting protein